MKSKKTVIIISAIAATIVCAMAVSFGVLKSGETVRRKLQMFCFVDGGRIIKQEGDLALVKKMSKTDGASYSIWSSDDTFYRVLEYRIGYADEAVAEGIFDFFTDDTGDKISYSSIDFDTEENADTDAEEIDRDNQLLDKFVEVTESFFPEKAQRSLFWVKKECPDNAIGIVQVPIFDEGGMQDMTWFCEDICDWIEECLDAVPYDEAPWLYKEITVEMPSVAESFDPSPYISEGYNREAFFEGLYDFVDGNITTAEYPAKNQHYGMLEFIDNGSDDYLATIEPDCTYTTKDGTVYGMLPVDRAAGSSYYSFVAYKKGSSIPSAINENPYCGSGGQASWIEFIDDTNLGFSCLTYNGGDDALLFRTEDGGRSFAQVNYPSARVKLSDGTMYNPFTIPEKVWKEDDALYMLVGQSPWSGDYNGDEDGGHPSGLYVSYNDGMSFDYIGEQ